MKRMLDICAGRLGWSKAFLARGWLVTAVDLVEPPEIPPGVTFIKLDVLKMRILKFGTFRFFTITGDERNPFWEHPRFDFICASTPCEEFSVWGMRHFHKNPPFPDKGIQLFKHVEALCYQSKTPFVMENVRPAQQFIGEAVHRCGSFYLWGEAVPPIMPQGISKSKWKKNVGRPGNWSDDFYLGSKKLRAQRMAEIPPELANCVAEYADRITELARSSETGAL